MSSRQNFARVSRAAVLAAGLAAAPAVLAQTAAPNELQQLRQQLEQSMQVIRQLADRVQQLEAGAKQGAAKKEDVAKQEDAAKQAARIETIEQQVAQIASAGASRSTVSDGVPLRGFADVGFSANRKGDSNKGFNVGTLSFYLTPQLGDRVKSLLELAFEVEREGGLLTDLERAQIGYTVSDQLTAWIGRIHTPIGYWNTAFHHGAQIQTAVRRPRFLDFEDKGGIMAMHTVGTWLTGSTQVGPGRVTYDAWVGNTPRIKGGVLDFKFAGATENHNITTGANVSYEFRDGAFEGLRVGAHGMRSKVDDDQDPRNIQRVSMTGGYVVYDTDRIETIAEYYHFRNRDLSREEGGRFSSNAGFIQSGIKVGKWTPYGRYERTKLDQNDLYFANQENGFSYHRRALGLRYDINPRTAVKFEVANTSFRDRDVRSGNDALVQFAIRF